jgi:hypothetical protein
MNQYNSLSLFSSMLRASSFSRAASMVVFILRWQCLNLFSVAIFLINLKWFLNDENVWHLVCWIVICILIYKILVRVRVLQQWLRTSTPLDGQYAVVCVSKILLLNFSNSYVSNNELLLLLRESDAMISHSFSPSQATYMCLGVPFEKWRQQFWS